MKVALICVGKNEEDHLVEFIEHYKNIGIDTIFFGDNDDYDTKQYDVLIPYINNNFVKYYNYQLVENIQHKFYNDIFNIERNNYDWWCVFDCDEYLNLNNKFNNIKEFLNNYNNYDQIKINWNIKISNHIYFNEPIGLLKNLYKNDSLKKNGIIKSIQNNKIKSLGPHEGELNDNQKSINIKDIFLDHYCARSCNWYINKIMRGRAIRSHDYDFYKIKTIDQLCYGYLNWYYNNININEINKAKEYLTNLFNIRIPLANKNKD